MMWAPGGWAGMTQVPARCLQNFSTCHGKTQEMANLEGCAWEPCGPSHASLPASSSGGVLFFFFQFQHPKHLHLQAFHDTPTHIWNVNFRTGTTPYLSRLKLWFLCSPKFCCDWPLGWHHHLFFFLFYLTRPLFYNKGGFSSVLYWLLINAAQIIFLFSITLNSIGSVSV